MLLQTIQISSRDCRKYFNTLDLQNWKNFKVYKSQIRSIHYIEFNKQNWLKSICNCTFWSKNLFCQHVIGLAVYKNKAQYKEVHMQIPIGQNRKRGQPKKRHLHLIIKAIISMRHLHLQSRRIQIPKNHHLKLKKRVETKK